MMRAFLPAALLLLCAVAALIAAEPSWWAPAGIGSANSSAAANQAPANQG
jgi:hypothetical protein